MKKQFLLLLVFVSFIALQVNGQWSITAFETDFTVDFDNTVADVNNGAFAGTGFATTPVAGQLDAECWAITGLSDGSKDFGIENTSGDYARGTSLTLETGGIYGYEVETGNRAFGVLPGGSDLTPGTIAMKIQNNTGGIIASISISYSIWVDNWAPRSQTFNGEVSLDGTNWTSIPLFEFATPEAIDANGWTKTTFTASGDFTIADEAFVYFRWNSNDNTGSGARDRIAIDDIVVNATEQTTTECGIASLPYSIDFESAVVPDLPDCTSVENAGTGNNWTTEDDPSELSSTLLYYEYNSSNAANTWFYTQGIDLVAGTSYRLTFEYATPGIYYPENLKVYYGTSAVNTDMTNLIVDHPSIATDENIITSTTDFTPSTSGTYYLGFNCYSEANQNTLYVDNILLDLSPSCMEPTNLFADNITTTSASLNWTNNSSATSWTIKYSTTSIDPSVDPGDGELTTSSNPFDIPISSLTPNTTYYWYVQAICAVDDLSYWSDEDEFSTECEIITSFPFEENFDGNWNTWCWEIVNNDADLNTWSQDNTYIDPTHSGTFAAHGMGNNDDYLISPYLDINGNMIISWWDKVENATYNNTYDVLVSTTDKNLASFTDNLGTFDCTNTAWTEHELDLSAYDGMDIYIAFYQTYSAADNYGFGIDDVTVRELSDENDILTFELDSQTGSATIDAGTYTVNIEVAMGTPLTALEPTITISDNADITPESGVAQDFTTSNVTPIEYTVTSESGIDQIWEVTVTAATSESNQKDILTFTLPEQTGAADIGDDYVNIEVNWNANLTNLTPTITVSDLATINPLSGVSNDFSTSPVVYTVTAEDATTKSYNVTVNQEAIPAGATCGTAINYGTVNDPEMTGTMTSYEAVWYTFTTTQAYANVILHTCGTVFDTKLAVFADCADYTNIPEYGEPTGNMGYNDDDASYCSDDNGQSLISYDILPAGTYYVVLYPFSTYTILGEGDYALEIIGDDNACLVPTNLAYSNLLQEEVTLTWDAGFNETEWNLIYGPTGFDVLTEGTTINNVSSPYNLTMLSSNTEYDVYVQAICYGPSTSDWSDVVTFTTPSDCPIPTGLTVSNVTSNSATLTWAELGMSAWVIEISSTPLTDPDTQTGDVADNVDVTGAIGTYNVTDLDANFTYYWYVKSDCGSDWSVQGEFTTECVIVSTFPYLEEFEDGVPPTCWTEVRTPTSSYGWETNTAGVSGNCAEFDSWLNSTGNQSTLSSQTFDITSLSTAVLEFDYKNPNGGDFTVLLSTDGGATYPNTLQTGLTDQTIWITVTSDLSSYISTGSNVKIALVGTSNYGSDDAFIYVDNFTIYSMSEINEIDINSDVADIDVCLGDVEATAIADLATTITITDTNDAEYVVDVTWTIDAFDGNTAADYNATGTFELPDGVSQPATPIDLVVTATVTVNELPVVECPETMAMTSEDAAITLEGATPTGGVYSGTNVTAGEFDPTGLTVGEYTITYTYIDPTTGCENSCDFNIDIVTSVDNLTIEGIGIYPNPNNGEFTINFNNIEGNVTYQIYDTKGSIIISQELTADNTEEVSLDLIPGVYYVKVVTATQTFVEKLVIE